MESTRAQAAQIKLELAQQAARAEAVEAQRLIDWFIAEAKARGLEPVPLRARLIDGRMVRTDKSGWYLRQDHSIAIDTDGGYQHLVVPGGWRERLHGARLIAAQPTLIVGRGGRDGETGTLREFLTWVLEGRVDQRG
ncbi:hypothetical protein [Tessaracoccus sp. OH4464_COT-324]|uniref:hypothetical protein n=1 Tax=Tessaracoccus sp. OH4464_COT-324 TaxID=2491059 RepID=UPI000F63FBF7|nr:hypothetical protein [Tessaracoccus sp. OH4464_COT-324]RRD46376.1 hypothetical protein EII42_07655 [Tessaracoccus sp. OH4464_COT-324]